MKCIGICMFAHAIPGTAGEIERMENIGTTATRQPYISDEEKMMYPPGRPLQNSVGMPIFAVTYFFYVMTCVERCECYTGRARPSLLFSPYNR